MDRVLGEGLSVRRIRYVFQPSSWEKGTRFSGADQFGLGKLHLWLLCALMKLKSIELMVPLLSKSIEYLYGVPIAACTGAMSSEFTNSPWFGAVPRPPWLSRFFTWAVYEPNGAAESILP